MKGQDEIFDLFKRNEHKLDERPTPMAWDRLEQRLDQYKPGHKKVFWRNYVAAVSMILLVSLAAFFAISDNFNKNNQMASSQVEKTAKPIVLTQEEAKPARPILMSHKEKVYYKQKDLMIAANKSFNKKPENLRSDQKPIAQANGDNIQEYITKQSRNTDIVSKTKELETVTEKFDESTVSYNTQPESVNIPAIDDQELIEDQVLGGNEILASDFSSGEVIEEPIEEIITTSVEQSESKMKLESIAKEDLPVQKPYGDDAAREYKDKSIGYSTGAITLNDHDELEKERAMAQAEQAKSWKPKKKGKAKEERAQSPMPSAPAVASSPQEDQAVMTETEMSPTDLNMQSNHIQYIPQTASNYDMSVEAIDQFNWILGNWKDQTGQSIEQWEKSDGLTIKGRGHFIVNGDTLFTEGMKIKQIDDHLYYIVAIDDSNTEISYKLKSFNNRMAIFENSNLNFPNQVVIQMNSDNNFSTTMQNSNPSQISGNQQLYLQNRNAISNEKATRSMYRTY